MTLSVISYSSGAKRVIAARCADAVPSGQLIEASASAILSRPGKNLGSNISLITSAKQGSDRQTICCHLEVLSRKRAIYSRLTVPTPPFTSSTKSSCRAKKALFHNGDRPLRRLPVRDEKRIIAA